MASFLDEIADYYQAAASVPADKIKVAFYPDDPDNMIAFLGRPGQSVPSEKQGVSALQFPRFQVVIRNTDYSAGDEDLRKIRRTLNGLSNELFPTYRLLHCHTDQDGGPIGQDDKGRFEFSISFYAEHHERTDT